MRRKLSNFAALPVSFLLGVCAQALWLSSMPESNQYGPESSQGRVSPDFDLTGYYYPAYEFPPAFSAIQRIDLTASDYRVSKTDGRVTRIPTNPRGYLVMNHDVFKLSGLSLDGGRVSFNTESRLGVSYQFKGSIVGEGDFPIKINSGYMTGKTVLIKGRLVGTLFGVKVVGSEVSFTKGFGC